MSARWPRSLTGRMVLLFVTAILLAQLIGLAFHVWDRQRLIDAVREEMVLSRLPRAVRALRDLAPEQRERVLEALESRWGAYAMGRDPIVAAQAPTTDFARRLSEALDQPEGSVRAARVRDTRPAIADVPWGDEPVAQILRIAIRLDDTAWLNVERPLHDPWWRIASRMVPTLALSALAILAAAILLARRIARPLRALGRQAERFGRGETVEHLPETGPQDVARTIRAFNDMSERQQRYIADRTRMLAAISHDLRTPITAMKIRIEMIDDDALRRRLETSLLEMERMVNSTLSFTRAEATDEPAREIDLAELIAQATSDVDPEGTAIELAWDETEPATFRGRPTALARALRNVLDNAVRYGGSARVELDRANGGYVIAIEDLGPGLADDALERVFEPFYRVDESRNAETGGNGLGLTIARSVIRGHGGDVNLRNREDGGLRVELRLP